MTTRDIAAEARELPREPTARWIFVLVTALSVVWLVILAWQIEVLPETVPTHFGAGGEPDGWSSKAGALAFSVLLPLLAAYPLPLISLLVVRWPAGISAPNREWWMATAPRLRRFERLLREDLWLVAALMLGLFVATQVYITLAARAADGQGLGWVVGAMLVSFLVLIGVVLARRYGDRYAEQPELR